LLRRGADGLVTYEFESLDGLDVVHRVFTRLGGVSRRQFAALNVGRTVGDRRLAVRKNHKRIFQAMNLRAGQVATAHQVHGNRVAVVGKEKGGRIVPQTDGLVTRSRGLALMLRFADCQPILLYDRRNHALGLVHAGWRGVAQGIARRAVETMSKAFETRPEDLIAGLGPAIGPCCYAVGQEVAAAMGYALPDWKKAMAPHGDGWLFDLPGANAQQLSAAGVKSIEQASLCTACHTDEFYSHRGENGDTGRFGVVAYLGEGTTIDKDGTTVRADASIAGTDAARSSLAPPGLPTFREVLRGRQWDS
jgi:YfiH family protein